MWKYNNENPMNNRVGDCVIRAISKALSQSWETTYIELCLQGYIMCDLPSANHVWGAYLRRKGFTRHIIPIDYGDHYTVEDFANDHPEGTYILALASHVVPVIQGNFYDTWNSGDEITLYFWQREDN